MTLFLSLLGIFIVWFLIARYLDNHGSGEYETSMILSSLFMIVTALMLVITNGFAYYNQVADSENLNVIDERIEIYEERSNDITSQLRSILIDEYTIHEKGIFDNMTGEGLSIYLAKYPELNAHKTFIALSETLTRLQDEVYAERINKVNIKRNMETRKRNPLVIKRLLPKE